MKCSATNIHAGTSAPVNAIIGDVFYETVSKTLQVYDGNAWCTMSSPVDARTEQEIEDALCNKHQGLKELRDLRDADIESLESQQKFAAYKALVREW